MRKKMRGRKRKRRAGRKGGDEQAGSKAGDNWVTCPVCDTSVKSKNLSRHLSRTHSELSEAERKELMGSRKLAKKVADKYKAQAELSARELRSLRRLEAELGAKSRIKRFGMAIGIVLIVIIVAYNLVGPPGSEGKAFKSELVPEIPKELGMATPSSWPVVPAPEFSGTDVLTGRSVSLISFRGSLVLLNFVNYGCDPQLNQIVSAQLLAVKELWSERRNDFEPLSVFCGCCPEDTLKTFAEQNELTWTWILDSDYSIIKLYIDYVSAYSYPTLIFIDVDGDVRDATGFLEKSELSSKIDQYI
jgi:uncharacterized C2H2 Zn-finger protein